MSKHKLEKEKPYLLKNKTISGGGAPISKPSISDGYTEEMLKPFLKNSENITEQSRIAKQIWCRYMEKVAKYCRISLI